MDITNKITMDILNLNFSPTTKGEYLFQYILKDIIGRKKISELHSVSALQIGGRLDELFEYYTGVLAANLLARCIKKANAIVSSNESELSHQRLLVRYFQDSLEIPKSSSGPNLDRLATLTLEAESSSRRDISATTRKHFNSPNTKFCYICGETVYATPANGLLKMQLEHIWPQSYGGDSTIENLLPACPVCNEKKASMLLWQNSHVHSFVHKPNSTSGMNSIDKREKIAKHRRLIFQHAHRYKKTLKDAALALGPIDLSKIKPINRDDAIDFFNFEFH